MSGKKLTTVIADAGGTTTSWALVYNDQSIEYIDTNSYHPVNFNETFFENSKIFLKNHITEKVPLFFFGAGMGKAENKKILTDFFQPFFSTVMVLTDIQGMVLSLDLKNGAIAVMGTGSVLVEILNGTIRQQIGGLGHLLGDEGSAYYFGKLVCQAFYNNELTEEQKEQVAEHISQEKYTLDELLLSKYNVANLAKELDLKLFESFHRENIRLFFEKHIDNHIEIKQIYFVGSYAFYKKEYIKDELAARSIKKAHFIQKPIELFCDKFAIF